MQALLQYSDENQGTSDDQEPIDNSASPTLTDDIINKITAQIENVVKEKWHEESPIRKNPHNNTRVNRDPCSHSNSPSKTPPTSKHHSNCHYYPKATPTKSVSMEEWHEIYGRLKAFDDEKHERVKQRTEEKKKAEMAEARFTPTISKASEKMVRNHEDIVQRMKARKEESDKKLTQLRKLKEDSMMSAVKPSPTINPQSQKLSRPKNIQQLWTMERNKRLKALQDKQREAEEESLKKLFKPKINPKSAQLAEKRKDVTDDVATRLTEQHKVALNKLEEMRKQLEPTHAPTINDRSRSIKLASPVHERLYQVGMEHIVSKHKFMADNWDFSYNLKKPLHLDAEPSPSINVPAVNADVEEYDETLYSSNNNGRDDSSLLKWDLQPTENDLYGSLQEYDSNMGHVGYDEDLRRMMVEAGFFKSQYASTDLNSGEDLYPRP